LFHFTAPATPTISTLSLHDALPIYDRADDRSDQRAAAADRHPDHRFDGIGRCELAWIDDADLRHIERARYARHAGRYDKDKQLRSEEHTSELQSQSNLVCRLLLEKK